MTVSSPGANAPQEASCESPPRIHRSLGEDVSGFPDAAASTPGTAGEAARKRGSRRSLAVALIVLVLIVVWLVTQAVPLAEIAARGDELRVWCRHHPLAAGGGALLVLIGSSALSLPLAAVLTMSYGWLFGAAWGTVLVSFGSTAGASVAFLASRAAFRRVGGPPAAAGWQAFLDRDAAWTLFALRLQPTIPFFLINAAMGTTRIPLRTFWWVSQIAMLPLTMVYATAGSVIPGLREIVDRGPRGLIDWRLVTLLSLGGAVPWLIRLALRRAGRALPEVATAADDSGDIPASRP